MLGIVVNGLYRGGSLHRENDSKAMYIQTQNGKRIPINKTTALSAKKITDSGAYDGHNAMMITWINGETSTILIGATSMPANSSRDVSANPRTRVPNSTPSTQGAPTFTPPPAAAPTFTAPNQGVPTFVPPTAAPTFTPPTAPRFTPPARSTFSGPACHFHPDEPAVKRCARCGKPICRDCVDNYQVTNDEYAGKPLCYDCCHELVSDNIAQLKANLKKIKSEFILSIIGMVIGFIIGLTSGIESGDLGSGFITGFVFACIGGVFLSAVKAFFTLVWELIKAFFSDSFDAATCFVFIVQCIIIVFKCIWVTISNTIQYIIYIKKTNGFIESDTAFLQQIKDYMEYTLVRNKYEGVDIETLLAQESRLADNSFARMVREQGEAQAEANLRGVTATINEHGEIIRSFAS